MLESPVYRAILEEGRQEGRQEGLYEDVLAVLEVRFGPVPAAVEEQVRRQQEPRFLAALHRRAIQVESLAVFARELAEGRLGKE